MRLYNVHAITKYSVKNVVSRIKFGITKVNPNVTPKMKSGVMRLTPIIIAKKVKDDIGFVNRVLFIYTTCATDGSE